MEFETNQPAQGSSDVDELARAAARTRINTVMPTHDGVAPEEFSDEQIVTQHTVQPAPANAANDTEYTQGDATASIVEPPNHQTVIMISVSVLLVIFAVLAYVFFVAL